ncbi:low temperature requirement protein A [Arthrobacter sp. Soil736]|uniref:low temperature requirement protein A n=1 Tax=Arthrobacter sp. Soil736 TaxID=1736395 RepID=UPI000A3DDEA9|nr:low temperature requirement protein A [Arthrobacter sp. Soil736]
MSQIGLGHGLTNMSGRDPNETDRSATPLELLYDLTFVVAFGLAADQLAHMLAEAHIWEGIGGFSFAMFAICWAWTNFSWFASAFDTNDWLYRIMTMVQMIGVVILALGLPPMFHSLLSLEAGGSLDNRIMVAGYVIMRVAMVAQWLRAISQAPKHRRAALAHASFIFVAQLGWVALALTDAPPATVLAMFPVLILLELAGPVLVEKRHGGTPWHAHHLAERYGLLTIIALGEGVFGTVASVSALVEREGWSTEAVVAIVAGVGLTFGLWWNYFITPSAQVLARHRRRAVIWACSHIVTYAAIAATGAGLHVVAYTIQGTSRIGTLGAVTAVAVPVLIFEIVLFALYTFMMQEFDIFHIALIVATILLIATALALAAFGSSIGLCLIIVTLSPAIVVVGYETIGRKHAAEALARTLAGGQALR